MSENKIQENFKKYLDGLVRLFGEKIANNIIEALGGKDKVSKATFSHLTESGSAFDGSLIKNIIKMANYAKNLNAILPTFAQADENSIYKVCMLCQIAKVLLYEENDNNWEIINRGMAYKFNNKLEGALRIGERSTLIAMNVGVKFSEREFEAMRIIDKDYSEDNYTRYYSSPLATVIRQANELITLTNRIEQIEKNEQER
jgi:hypothetical protein